MDRRRFLKNLGKSVALTGLGTPLFSCGRAGAGRERKVVVLGLDGLDPSILRALIGAGRAPNFQRLAEMGAFSKLGTTMPALSPVAWSSFITGMTPGGHGVADFILRDPETYQPVFSIWESRDPALALSIGAVGALAGRPSGPRSQCWRRWPTGCLASLTSSRRVARAGCVRASGRGTAGRLHTGPAAQ